MPAGHVLTSVGEVNITRAHLRDVDVRRPWVLDGALAALLLIGSVLAATFPGPGSRTPDAVMYVLILVGCAPYAVRRRAPLPVMLVASVPVVALLALGFSSAVIGSGLFLAAYTVGDRCGTRAILAAAGYAAVLLAALTVALPESLPVGEVATNAALFIGAFALGRSGRARRENVVLLQERATLAEQARVEQARNAVVAERLRIARELHDVLAHSMGVIALQAGVGAHVIDVDPAEAKASLVAVSETSRSALAEIRRILGALRDETDPTTYSPQPGLAAVDGLAADLRAAGLPVAVHVEGEPDRLPAALDLTGYRLIQEALTNVVKHAGPARAEVTVRYAPGSVEIEVLDDGRATTPGDGPRGRGQVGMRERVGVWGGSLTTGPRPGGGYRVAARLPYGTEGER